MTPEQNRKAFELLVEALARISEVQFQCRKKHPTSKGLEAAVKHINKAADFFEDNTEES